MVGAAAPHLLSRHEFSNYGQRLDVHGWGSGVYTTGFGDLQCGPDPIRWYTGSFSGTSSASPCVAGCVAVVQGVLKARGRRVLSPAEAKYLLRLTGSPQRDSPNSPRTERIGSRPDLRALIPAACGWASRTGDFDGDGVAEFLVTGPEGGVALLKKYERDNIFWPKAHESNDSVLDGGWRLDTTDNTFGPVADFDGDGRAEVFVSSPLGGVAILKFVPDDDSPTLAASAKLASGPTAAAAGGGKWTLDMASNSFGPAGDFDGDGKAELLVVSPKGLGILKQAGNGLACQLAVDNKAKIGSWQLDTADNDFSVVGRFSSAGAAGAKTDMFVSSSTGISILQLQIGTGGSANSLKQLCALRDKDKLGRWTLQCRVMRFRSLGDFDGDGRDEILATSPHDIAVLKLVGGTLTLLAYAENNASLGTNPAWPLQLADNHFGPARDFDGDGKTELIVTSSRAVGIIKLAGGLLVPLAVQLDKSTFHGGNLTWTLDTADNWFGSAATYTKSGRAGILVSSPTAMTILEYDKGAGTFQPQAVAMSGARLGSWLLDISSDNLGHGV
ncbi:hypothetical protein OQA88_12446 [Cercophora sp. LCS_1]